MLSLKKIVKNYTVGDTSVPALKGVSIDFRKHEFVSILGPSGCGKTTLLNIIGGLDQYTSGDLIINGVSTSQYRDSDWDTYRNHSIGFVFQSYNLIPHQTVLANVELALTLSGVSRKERRRRAINALRQVGLTNQIYKRPNQMSGGQMQRVAIARALVNDPDILLADEPTGALDTQTSIQIMEILREISKNKLIIMVTHNPDLAKEYSTRIIRLLDGNVVGDTNPVMLVKKNPDAPAKERKRKGRKRKPSMSFFTALSLSLNNLMTKKGRTFMTSFAGSIGIIGIALILSVSSGVNAYINSVQRDTLASYPIQLQAETVDLSALVTSLMGAGNEDGETAHERDRVYESSIVAELFNSLNSIESNKNDLTAFKQHMETHPELFSPYLTAVQYSYRFHWRILTQDSDGNAVKSDVTELFKSMSGRNNASSSSSGSGMMSGGDTSSMAENYSIWEEMLAGTDGSTVNQLIKDQYDLIYGAWPENYDEILLVVDERNEISDLSLYALGLRTEEEIMKAMMNAANGGMIDLNEIRSYSYEEICQMRFRMLLASECYQVKADGSYTDLSDTPDGRKLLFNNTANGVELKVVGIIRPNEDATSNLLNGTVVYTSKLSDYALAKTLESPLIKAQLGNPSTDVFNGLPFLAPDQEITNEEKKSDAIAYIDTLSDAEKVQLYRNILSAPSDEEVNAALEQALAAYDDATIEQMLIQGIAQGYNISEADATAFIAGYSAEARRELLADNMREAVSAQIQQAKLSAIASIPDDTILMTPLSDEQYVMIYDDVMPPKYSDGSYDDNLAMLGYVEKDSPVSISLFASTFENKDEISRLIKEYNDTVEEEKQISYTDYVALLMSSVTTIVNAISYVLIAFVAISLVVSSIMIGIITYISVLERTKEIGVLRAIGASKRDIGRVFNAETLIVGFVAGAIGIVATVLLNQVINIILYHFTGLAALKAVLPVGGAIVLVLISMFLTFIAGLIPSGVAARKNPVEALRSE